MDDQTAKLLDHQATLTLPLRRFLYRQVALPRTKRVLDVGCGTGAICAEMAQRNVEVTGVDVDAEAIARAKSAHPKIDFLHIEPGPLPFKRGTFGLAFCHFVLMWQSDPVGFLREMARVTRPGGFVVAAAEPDWGARITHPDDGLTDAMIQALLAEGADPFAGRKLRAHFQNAGLQGNIGVWPSAIEANLPAETLDAEWAFYQYTLRDSPKTELLEPARKTAKLANDDGSRTVFTPLFYAVARR